jgi:hypothetical protein
MRVARLWSRLSLKYEEGATMNRRLMGMLVSLALVVGIAPIPALAQAVVPAETSVELAPGESVTVEKQVTTPEIPPTPDIYFLADTTGSMGSSIAAVQADAAAILEDVLALDPGARFGVGDYKDFPYDPWAFKHQQAITADTAAVISAAGDWAAGGGSDGPEGQFYALYKIATDPAIGWRTGTSRIVVWFGDAPGHDPIPAAATGLDFDITEAVLIDALADAGIRVIAVSVTSGYAEGLDAAPGGAGDYGIYPDYVAGGEAGQATRIAAATGGVSLFDVDPDDVVAAILAGITDIRTDVWATAEADPGLSISFDPAVRTDIAAGATADFDETISVSPDAVAGSELTAVVTFWAGSYPADGAALGQQTVTVSVPAAAPPTGPVQVEPDPERGEPVVVVMTPRLPATGLGPDRSSLLWAGVVVIGLALGFGRVVRRRSATSAD